MSALYKRLWSDGTFRISPGTADAYLAAMILLGLATFVRWGLSFLGAALLPFTAYYPAVLFATYLGGLRVGSFVAVLGGLIGWWLFMPSYFGFLPIGWQSIFELATYVLTCALLIWAADSYRRLAERLQREENLRKLAVDELAHRLKNKIATIQSIIGYQLREQPDIRRDIIGRLVALSATDDLIMKMHGKGASIRAILNIELGPYDLSRTSLQGPDILLAPNLALTIALLVHELATNAAKHGALSSAVGYLSICWSVENKTLNLEWRENGGPAVKQPTHRGFGLRLLSGALDQFNGSVETIFEKSGLICKMKAPLSEDMPSIVPEHRVNSPAAV